MVTQCALEYGCKHLQMILIGIQRRGRWIGNHILERLLQRNQWQRRILGNIPQKIYGSNQTDIRLDITVELFLSVVFRVYIQAIRHENPGINGEIILNAIFYAVVSKLEFNRKVIVLLCLYRDHIRRVLEYNLTNGVQFHPRQQS